MQHSARRYINLRPCKLLRSVAEFWPLRAAYLLTPQTAQALAPRVYFGKKLSAIARVRTPNVGPDLARLSRACSQFGEARRIRSAQLAPSFRAPFRPGTQALTTELHQRPARRNAGFGAVR